MIRLSFSSLAAAMVFLVAVGPGAEAATASTAAPPSPATTVDPEVTRLISSLGLVESPQPVRERRGWQPPRRIVVRRFGPDTAAWLQSVAPGVTLDVVDSPAQALAALPGADALLGFCEAPLVAAGTRLAWVQAYFAGVDQCGTAVIGERGLLFTNMQRLAGPPMAEHVMALLLALSRQLPAFLASQREGRWAARTGETGTMRTLEGKTLLVYGLGGIGTEVAKRAHGLGMRVTAIRASGHSGPDTVSYVGLPDELPKLAAEADVVVNCAPLTAATRGVFDAKFFAGMKPSAYFINVGRGGSVVTADLVAALETGKIAGAGLDVTDPEPLPPDNPLWHARNVLITPHVSSASDEDPQARLLIVRENLRRYVAGERMLSVVDAGRGY
jgi:phosphoglycerate dehydrogenase-like enzyme